MAEDKKSTDPTLDGFYEAMERTDVEKITNKILAGLSGDSNDSEGFDIESENENAKIGRGDLATLFLGNPPSSKVRLNR
jgi:hypothetical protein